MVEFCGSVYVGGMLAYQLFQVIRTNPTENLRQLNDLATTWQNGTSRKDGSTA